MEICPMIRLWDNRLKREHFHKNCLWRVGSENQSKKKFSGYLYWFLCSPAGYGRRRRDAEAEAEEEKEEEGRGVQSIRRLPGSSSGEKTFWEKPL